MSNNFNLSSPQCRTAVRTLLLRRKIAKTSAVCSRKLVVTAMLTQLGWSTLKQRRVNQRLTSNHDVQSRPSTRNSGSYQLLNLFLQ